MSERSEGGGRRAALADSRSAGQRDSGAPGARTYLGQRGSGGTAGRPRPLLRPRSGGAAAPRRSQPRGGGGKHLPGRQWPPAPPAFGEMRPLWELGRKHPGHTAGQARRRHLPEPNADRRGEDFLCQELSAANIPWEFGTFTRPRAFPMEMLQR